MLASKSALIEAQLLEKIFKYALYGCDVLAVTGIQEQKTIDMIHRLGGRIVLVSGESNDQQTVKGPENADVWVKDTAYPSKELVIELDRSPDIIEDLRGKTIQEVLGIQQWMIAWLAEKNINAAADLRRK